eukprot:4601175-Lingulodinium_polyedra.AAC.1
MLGRGIDRMPPCGVRAQDVNGIFQQERRWAPGPREAAHLQQLGAAYAEQLREARQRALAEGRPAPAPLVLFPAG